MKRRFYVSSLASVFAIALAIGQTSSVEGTWEGNLHGVKAITLTVWEAAGRLEGDAVFYILRREGTGWHNGAASPQIPLQNVRREGATLHFSLKGSNGQPVEMEMKLAGPDTATLTRQPGSMPALSIPVRRTSER